MQTIYPFSAIVGQEDLKTALLLSCVDQSLGGVLIQGEKGTAKTTAVRGLASLLESGDILERRTRMSVDGDLGCEISLRSPVLTELPLNATEDRISGSIQLEGLLQDGTRRFEPGLLAQAHNGILYVDEVNLLESHLVDILLDAAATGVNRVEREGLSVTHPSRFILTGTMNPEEGELRPQFLDRFGFTVLIDGLRDPEARREIVRRRLAFDADPETFHRAWEAEEEALAHMIRRARTQLSAVTIPEDVTAYAVDLCSSAEVAGHRADITLIRGARSLAAMLDEQAVTRSHVAAVARYVLSHRLPKSGIEGMRELADKTDKLISGSAGAGTVTGTSTSSGDRGSLNDPYDETEVPGATAAGSLLFTHLKKKIPGLKSPLRNPA